MQTLQVRFPQTKGGRINFTIFAMNVYDELKRLNADIVMRDLADLKPNPKNPRKATKEAIEKLAESIKKHPYFFKARPILLSDRTGELVIIGGERRSEAAALLKMETVPTILLSGLTEAQEDEILIKDNTHAGVWDEQKLQAWGKEQLQGWNVDGVKWPKQETEILEDDFNPEKQVKARCLRGDIWQLGEHRLMCGDSTKVEDVQKLTGGEMIDLLMTDPPYGISADKMTMGTGKQTYQRGEWDESRPDITPILGYARNVCIWGGNYFTDVLPVTNDWLCWHKNNDGLSFSEFELAWTNFGRNCRHITHHWGGEKKIHITMKPVGVIAWAIRQTKEECHTILDLFGGSGTTIIASEQLGRKCYMMELDPAFCDVIITRWEQYTGQKAIKIE